MDFELTGAIQCIYYFISFFMHKHLNFFILLNIYKNAGAKMMHKSYSLLTFLLNEYTKLELFKLSYCR